MKERRWKEAIVYSIGHLNHVVNVTRRLLCERYSETDLQLIRGGNFLRIMEQVQASKSQY